MLKAIIASLDDIEKNLRGLYGLVHTGPHAGKFRLQVEPVDGHGLADTKVAERWKAHATKLALTHSLDAALTKAQVDAPWRDHFTEQLMARLCLIEEDGRLVVQALSGDGQLRMNHRGEPMSVDELVAATTRDFPRCFGGSSTSSSGSSPSYAGPNPFAKETFSVTGQGRLFRSDPALYACLKAEAERGSGGSGQAANPFRRESWSLTRQGELFRTDRAAYERLKAEAVST